MQYLRGITVAVLCAACSAESTGTSPSPTRAAFTATLVENVTATSLTGGGTFTASCVSTVAGAISMKMNSAASAVSGDVQFTGTVRKLAASGATSLCNAPDTEFDWSAALTGTPASFSASTARNFTGQFPQVVTLTLTGSQGASTVSGTFEYRRTSSGTNAEGTTTLSSSGTATVSVSFF